MLGSPGGTPPATPDNVVEKLAATFTMEYLTGHYRLLRDDEQRSFDQLRVIMLAFFAASCKALRAEVAQMTQERDTAKTQATYWHGQTEAWQRQSNSNMALMYEAEARVVTLTEKVTEYETRPWPGCRMLSLGDACDCSLCEQDRKMAALTAGT